VGSAHQEVFVEVDIATLAMSARGSITGVVFIRGTDRSFPASDWSDFPVVILDWWLEPVSQILQRKTKTWMCRFMEGPLTMQLTQQDGDSWLLTGANNGCTEFEAAVSCRTFIRSLLGAAREILTACGQRRWSNADIDKLASTLKRLELEAL
jgi:hypothetical protein